MTSRFPRAQVWLGWDQKFGRIAPWLLLIVALLYYASYFRTGLNLGGEGGTNAIVAMRIMEGQRPIVDTFLGYNVMWFYPLVWLFEWVGPSYAAMKVYFFGMCTATTLLAYVALVRYTRWSWFSFGVALMPMLLPGMQFRNYMGFLGVLNLLLLHGCFVRSERAPAFPGARLAWFAAAGLGVGLTFLIRIDLGIFFLLLYLGGALLAALAPGRESGERIQTLLAGWLMIPLLAVMLHLPVYAHAERNGFGSAFADQYVQWGRLIYYGLLDEAKKLRPVGTNAAALPVIAMAPAVESAAEAESGGGSGTLARPAISGIWTLPRGYDRTFVWSIYLPMVLAPIMVLLALGLMIAGWWCRQYADYTWGLGLLLATGSALTLWPQYYFFRPDLPHLSEFMVPFYVALGMFVFLSGTLMRRWRSLPARVGLGLVVLLGLFDGIAYPYYAVPKEGAGGNALSRGRFSEFQAENGVDVLLKNWERDGAQALYETIMKYSDTDDYVTVYPYSPTILLMTDRRSYEWNLYIDNATATDDFFDTAIRNLREKQPAVIVVDNRDINRNEASRFRNWAKPLYGYIQANYVDLGVFGRRKLEVFVRPDKFRTVHAGDVINPER